MKSQYQEAIAFIQESKADHYYLNHPESGSLVLDALLRAFDLVSIQVECSFHGVSEKTKMVYLMNKGESDLIEALIRNINRY